MKTITSTLLLSLGLLACNAPNSSENIVSQSTSPETESPEVKTEQDNQNFQAIDSEEALIATALMAAPKASREGCTVMGYNMAGEFVTFQEGDNEFICLTDNPKQEGFNAACYHKDLEPFMARGRELKAEGKSGKEVFDIREEEAKSGKLKMGPAGTTLHIYYGPEATYNPETNEVSQAKYRYVVYMPFATAESTGLPESPIAPNHPWIMDPGTHRAHIMITPLAGEKE